MTLNFTSFVGVHILVVCLLRDIRMRGTARLVIRVRAMRSHSFAHIIIIHYLFLLLPLIVGYVRGDIQNIF